MPSNRNHLVNPSNFAWGDALLGGMRMANEDNRRNALLGLEGRRVDQYGRQLDLQEERMRQDDLLQQANSQQAKRRLDRGAAFALAARTGRFEPALPYLADFSFDPETIMSDGPEAARELFGMLAEKDGFGAGNIGQLYQYEGEQGPVYGTAQEARGKRPHVKPTNEAKGTWSQPFEAIDPASGKPGMFQSHSLSGEIRPATVGAQPIGPKPAKEGAESTAPDSLMWRQAVAYFGGIVDPQTGAITGLDPTQTARTQDIAAKASRIYRESGGGISPAEAVQEAISGKSQRGAAPAPNPARDPRNAAPQGDIREGAQAFNRQTGEWIEFRGGQWVPIAAPNQ